MSNIYKIKRVIMLKFEIIKLIKYMFNVSLDKIKKYE